MSTLNVCFRAKIRKNVYPCTPQFYYTKVGCKEAFVTRTCFRDRMMSGACINENKTCRWRVLMTLIITTSDSYFETLLCNSIVHVNTFAQKEGI